MSQVVLEFSNRDDLALLLSLAKRLNANIVSIKSSKSQHDKKNRRLLLKKAANDPLFLADVSDITDDFKHIDRENV